MFDAVIINDDLEKAYEELKEILDEVSKSIKSLLLCTHQMIGLKYLSPLSLHRKLKKFRRHNHNKEIRLSAGGQEH